MPSNVDMLTRISLLKRDDAILIIIEYAEEVAKASNCCLDTDRLKLVLNELAYFLQCKITAVMSRCESLNWSKFVVDMKPDVERTIKKIASTLTAGGQACPSYNDLLERMLDATVTRALGIYPR